MNPQTKEELKQKIMSTLHPFYIELEPSSDDIKRWFDCINQLTDWISEKMEGRQRGREWHDISTGYSEGWKDACKRYGIELDPRNMYIDQEKLFNNLSTNQNEKQTE